MHKALILPALMLFVSLAMAQELPNLNFDFSQKPDFKKHEDEIMLVADYILSRPVNDDSQDIKNATALLLKWMDGTPDYHFVIDNTVASLIKKNDEVLRPILACMVSTVLHNKDKANDQKEMKRLAYTQFFTYCENPVNKVKVSKEIKSGIEAKNSGSLDKYLNI